MKGILLITEREANSQLVKMDIFLDSTLINFGEMGIVAVDRKLSRYPEFLQKGIELAKITGNPTEQSRLETELERHNHKGTE